MVTALLCGERCNIPEFSNFFRRELVFRGIRFKTSEHAYVWCKATNDEDRAAIIACTTPGRAKRLGKNIVCRADWKQIRVTEMTEVLDCKFGQHQDLMDLLMSTTGEILEETTWDDFWGLKNGTGQNHLGRLLMDLRTREAAKAALWS